MLIGYPPFFSDEPSQTCQKILNWRKNLMIPAEANLSPESIDLLRRLLTDANERLGINGVEEIKAHPFFAGVDWRRIRDKKAPYLPDLKNEIDTSNFDHYDEEEAWYVEEPLTKRRAIIHQQGGGNKENQHQYNQFWGYTFKRDFDNERQAIIQALEQLETIRCSTARQPTSNRSQIIPSGKESHTPTNAPLHNIDVLASKTGFPINDKRESFPLPARAPMPINIPAGLLNKDYYSSNNHNNVLGGNSNLSKSPNNIGQHPILEKNASSKPNFSKLMLQYGKGTNNGNQAKGEPNLVSQQAPSGNIYPSQAGGIKSNAMNSTRQFQVTPPSGNVNTGGMTSGGGFLNQGKAIRSNKILD